MNIRIVKQLLAACVLLVSSKALATPVENFATLGTLENSWNNVSNYSFSPGVFTTIGNAFDGGTFGRSGLNISTAGMNFVAVTARRNAGHNNSTLFVITFLDYDLNDASFSVSSSSFSDTGFSTVYIPVSSWSPLTGNIVEYMFGGGNPSDDQAYRMSFSNIELSAVPEPQTFALLACGLGALVIMRQRRKVA